ncbi:hypothetical protein DFQ27_007464 [Actinomortierella ambigua]|uniref:Uncharacterized protein n=1 Tax=Actinomortierella ambigua TaxID=1343610 RepID=A0A9P6QGN1_9FUNG|nr:hypothetical protein DFQ27_007464 [Actinomortierella ambigua]
MQNVSQGISSSTTPFGSPTASTPPSLGGEHSSVSSPQALSASVLAILEAEPTCVPVHFRVWGDNALTPCIFQYPLRVDSTDYSDNSAWYSYILYPELYEMLGIPLDVVAVRFVVPNDPTEYYAVGRQDRPRRLEIPSTALKILVEYIPQSAIRNHYTLPIATPSPALIAQQLATVPLTIPPHLVSAVVVTFYGPPAETMPSAATNSGGVDRGGGGRGSDGDGGGDDGRGGGGGGRDGGDGGGQNSSSSTGEHQYQQTAAGADGSGEAPPHRYGLRDICMIESESEVLQLPQDDNDSSHGATERGDGGGSILATVTMVDSPQDHLDEVELPSLLAMQDVISWDTKKSSRVDNIDSMDDPPDVVELTRGWRKRWRMARKKRLQTSVVAAKKVSHLRPRLDSALSGLLLRLVAQHPLRRKPCKGR